jgi:hypothetical protein
LDDRELQVLRMPYANMSTLSASTLVLARPRFPAA